MSGATVIVMYPRKEGSTFNADYYISTHMPLAKRHWEKHGLKSYTVSELNADGPYSYTVVTEWESLEGFGKAAQDPSIKEIMDDVENFSSEKPILVHGGIIARG